MLQVRPLLPNRPSHCPPITCRVIPGHRGRLVQQRMLHTTHSGPRSRPMAHLVEVLCRLRVSVISILVSRVGVNFGVDVDSLPLLTPYVSLQTYTCVDYPQSPLVASKLTRLALSVSPIQTEQLGEFLPSHSRLL